MEADAVEAEPGGPAEYLLRPSCSILCSCTLGIVHGCIVKFTVGGGL